MKQPPPSPPRTPPRPGRCGPRGMGPVARSRSSSDWLAASTATLATRTFTSTHGGFDVRGPTQTDRFRPFRIPKWVGPLKIPLPHSYFIGRIFEEANVDRTLLTTSSMSSSRICLAAGAAQVECIWRVAGLMEEHKSIWTSGANIVS
jgi:hypothetical protein